MTMEELFKDDTSSDIYFAGFANDLGNKLDRLKFEFEGLENGVSHFFAYWCEI